MSALQRILPARRGIAILILFHVVGIVGMLSPYAEWFRMLTPLHLLLSFTILLSGHPKFDAAFAAFFLLCFVLGYSAEWIGVHTGWLFGDYAYGPVLGFKIDGIPLLIGINWYLLSYTTSVISAKTGLGNTARMVLGAALMTGLDVLIEPVAIHNHFWNWNQGFIPWTNYACWFGVSLLMQRAALSWNRVNNRQAVVLGCCQLAFFGILAYFQTRI
jgi:putative membrane protein